jgi:glucosamine-6-phosphate deaminase
VRLCLPTGRTPRPAYAAFAAGGGDLGDTDVFLLDEFVLPDRHPARCDEMLQRDLLDLLPGPPRALHALDPGAADLDAECARYAALVADGGLDLTLLGLGGNGHLGLNEPGSGATSPTRAVDLTPETTETAAGYGAGAAPSRGVTLGMADLLASHEVWLLVTGEHKADILRRSVTGPVGPEVPASYLRGHPNTLVLADAAAASLLP